MIQTDFTWTRPKEIIFRRVPFSKIDIPGDYRRKELSEDEALKNSIKSSGIQQPLILLSNGSRFILVKGGRRIRLAEDQGQTDGPAIIYDVPEGIDENAYRDRLRAILTKLRQDLPFSQQASIIRQTIEQFGLSQKEIAAMIGWNAGTVTHRLAIEHYLPEVRAMIDQGQINSHQATALEGLNEKGQRFVLRKFGKELRTMAGRKVQRLVKAKLSPRTHPDLYENPAKAAEKLAKKKEGRRSRRRPRITKNEKTMLAQSLELAEIELNDLTADISRMKRLCMLASVPLNAIMRNEKLVRLIKKETDFHDELERFVQVY